jgi:glycosyltransferase involved in cell wall biosynthesis
MAYLTVSDPVQFCRAIYEALNEYELATEKAEEAKREVEKKYSYSVFRKKLLKAYSSVCLVSQ